MRKITVGFLGCGNIGCGVWKLLHEFENDLQHRSGVSFEVKRILVRDVNKKRDEVVPVSLLTTDPKEITDDPALLDAAETIIDHAIACGLADGGMLTFCDCYGYPADFIEWDMKKWWPQCEAMLATKMAYLKTGKEKYLTWYNTIEKYVEDHFIDRENGEWYGYLHYDGTVANTLKGNITKGPFHIPRMLLLLEKMEQLAKDGKKLIVL